MNAVLQISPKILKSFASIFSDSNRIIMEYIDNAIDAAEKFYIPETNSYSKSIEISVGLDGNSHDYARIEIKDNCTGIKNLARLLSSVGNSTKVEERNTNGQFGFGMYSFLVLCNTMTINAKHNENQFAELVTLKAATLDVSDSKGAEFEITTIPYTSYEPSSIPPPRVWVTLEDFTKERFKDIDMKILRGEIEKHFELILNRNNIKIIVIDHKRRKSDGDRIVMECSPFDYESYEGITYMNTLTELEYIKSKKYSTTARLDISENPIKVYLRILTKKALDRRPVFIIKGRRIGEISEIKTFKTFSKNQIWSNSNVTGFIDVTGIVEPDISRSDFQSTRYSQALFYTIRKLEDEIKEVIATSISTSNSSDFKKLEDELKRALKNLTHMQKRRRKRKQIEDDDNNSISNQGRRDIKKDIKIRVPIFIDSNNDEETVNGKGSSYAEAANNFNDKLNYFFNVTEQRDTENKNTSSRKIFSGEYEIESLNIYEKAKLSDENELANQSTGLSTFKLDGLGIKLDQESEPIKDEFDKPLRSALLNGNIVIFMKHPLFQQRLISKEDGFPRFTSELVTYLAAEIITQYMLLNVNDAECKEMTDMQIYSKLLLREYVEMLHGYIYKLKHLEGKKLSELTS